MGRASAPPEGARLFRRLILRAVWKASDGGHSYRRYTRTVLVPGLRQVAATLKAHDATIEVSASRRPRPAASAPWPPLLKTLWIPRPPHRTVGLAIESLAGGEVPGRRLERRRGRYLRTPVVRLRKLLGGPAQCLGGRGLHRHVAGIAAPVHGAGGVSHV